MKLRTYTFACSKNGEPIRPNSKSESKFEEFVEKKFKEILKSGKKKPVDNWFLKVNIEE